MFKSDDETDISNYRPISLLSNFNKIFEKLMYNRMTRFINLHSVLFGLPWVPKAFSRVWRGAWSAAGQHNFGRRPKTPRLDRNQKPRMKSLWHPGYSRAFVRIILPIMRSLILSNEAFQRNMDRRCSPVVSLEVHPWYLKWSFQPWGEWSSPPLFMAATGLAGNSPALYLFQLLCFIMPVNRHKT